MVGRWKFVLKWSLFRGHVGFPGVQFIFCFTHFSTNKRTRQSIFEWDFTRPNSCVSSSEQWKQPGCLRYIDYIGDYTTQWCWDDNESLYTRIPINQSVYWKVGVCFSCVFKCVNPTAFCFWSTWVLFGVSHPHGKDWMRTGWEYFSNSVRGDWLSHLFFLRQRWPNLINLTKLLSRFETSTPLDQHPLLTYSNRTLTTDL